MSEQPRGHNGHQGQYTYKEKPASKVQLFDRPDGSFYRPSPSRTAEFCIDFWSNVEVPDDLVDHFTNVYGQVRTNELPGEVEEGLKAEMAKFDEEFPEPRGRREKTEWQESRELYTQTMRPKVEAAIIEEHPMRLGEYDARQLIRAARMFDHSPSPSRCPEEYEKLGNHEIELFDETLTVWGIERKYRLHRLSAHLSNPPEDPRQQALNRQMAEMSSVLDKVQGELYGMRVDNQRHNDEQRY